MSHSSFEFFELFTNITSRNSLFECIDMALQQSRDANAFASVLYININRFKLVNDSFGYDFGDALLKGVAIRFGRSLRDIDTLVHLGGDEFIAVLPKLSSPEEAYLIGDKILYSLSAPFTLENKLVHIFASIGASVFPSHSSLGADLLHKADLAMRRAKETDAKTCTFFTPNLQEVDCKKVEFEQTLRDAILKNQLEMYYQPQIDAYSGTVVGAEALMRWNHPERGFLNAGDFLPFAEENGLMIPITDWMLSAICRDLRDWNKFCCKKITLSLNLPPQYLDSGTFYMKLYRTLNEYGIEPSQIEVEITESIAIKNPDVAISQLKLLRELGVSVALDDFGTGYSSLSYLHRFPVLTLKIDRVFVMQIEDDSIQYPVITAIIAIAQGLGLNLVAEGVETELQARYLMQLGCDTLQGYLYHRPLSHAKMQQLIC